MIDKLLEVALFVYHKAIPTLAAAVLILWVFMSYGCGSGISFPLPVPTATPTPTATVAPAPEPTPEPTILPTPPPAATPKLCDLPTSSAPQSACEDRPDRAPAFLEDLHEAQRLAANNGFSVDGRVVDEEAYTGEVARVLRAMGLCATNEGLVDEVWVKGGETGNSFSDHYDIVTSDGSVNDLFAARCTPAKF